jgi:hypothetical protein
MYEFSTVTSTQLGNFHKGIWGYLNYKKNSVAWVREGIIPTERKRLVGEVSANFWGQGVQRGQRDGSLLHSRISRPE